MVDSSGEPQVSSADTIEVSQGDQHTTMSALSTMLQCRAADCHKGNVEGAHAVY